MAGGPSTRRLPPIAAEDFSARYRQMCEMVLYGCAVMPQIEIAASWPGVVAPGSRLIGS